MRLHGIKAKNFLSLRDCTITDLDPHLNFIVGPNGSGKTNMFRLLKTIRDVFTAAATGRRSALGHLCTQGIVPQEVDVSITVEFDTPWEQELISAFLCATLSQPSVLSSALARLQGKAQSVQLSRAEHLFFAEWLAQHIRPETLPFFFRGVLRVTYRSDIYDYLRLSYTFVCKGEPVTIIMGSLAGFDGTFWRGDPPEALTNGPAGGELLLPFLYAAWEKEKGYSEEELELDLVLELNLDEKVVKERNERNEQKKREWSASVAQLFGDRYGSEPMPFDVEQFFFFLGFHNAFLEVEPLAQQYATLPIYSTLSEASGIDFRQANARKLIFSALFSSLVNRAWVFTNNVRLPFSAPTDLDINEALSPQVSLDDEQQIPLHLFRLKMGDPTEQARFRRIQESFSMLVGEDRRFDLTVKLLPQQSAGDSNLTVKHLSQQTTGAMQPTLDIHVMDAAEDISLAYQGAGVWEALVLSTLLDESEGHLVLLDEPAANLHPGMQHRLIEILRGAPGQVLVVTHSAHLLPTLADEFQRVYRLQKSRFGTAICSLGNTFATQEDKLENELRSSSDIAGLLFANGVLLVEGPTEIGAFSPWFIQSSASQGKTFADLNIVLHALNGKAELPFYLRFLTAFGVPWAVICDGDALLPPNKSPNDKLWKVLKELQLLAALPSDTASFGTLKAQAANAGVYTYNTSSPTKFETVPEIKHFLDAKWTPPGKTAYRGRDIALHLSCPSPVDEVFQQSMRRLTVR
jgi:energy-coupling factor transporter ATP-binding protein EcfA2